MVLEFFIVVVTDRHTTGFRGFAKIKINLTFKINEGFSRSQQGETWGTREGEDDEEKPSY